MRNTETCGTNGAKFTLAFALALVLTLFAVPMFAAGMLTDLTLSTGTLTQTFSPNTTAYFALVSEAETDIAVVPTSTDANATITVSINGEQPITVQSGSASPALSLELGTNVIFVAVNAGESSQTYRVTVPKRAVRFQQGVGGYQGTADTQLVQAVKYTSHNLGAQHKFEVGYSGPWARDQKYGLIQFDDLNIPVEATITEAAVNLSYYGDRASGGEDIVLKEKDVYAHRVRVPWTEGTGGNATSNDGDPAKEGETSWETFMAQPAPFHFDVLDTVVVGQEPGWYAWDITSLVADWLSGTLPNYGVLLKTYEYPENGDARMTGTKQFRSSEYEVVAERPYLSVAYTLPLKGITLDSPVLNLQAGESTTVTAFPRPLNAVYDAIVWSTDDASVAQVNGGTVTGVSAGETVVRATISSDNVAYFAEVTVRIK